MLPLHTGVLLETDTVGLGLIVTANEADALPVPQTLLPATVILPPPLDAAVVEIELVVEVPVNPEGKVHT